MVTLNLPDIVNVCITKNFTQVPNELIYDPTLSSNAFKIYCILISNPAGWRSHIQNIRDRMDCGETAVHTALQLLEQRGLILRVQVRDTRTKRRRTSFLSVTDVPYQFHFGEIEQQLAKRGLELYYKSYNIETHIIETAPHNNTIANKTINNKEKTNKKVPIKIPPTLEEVIQYCQERNKGVDPHRWYNFYQSKGWMIGKNKMKDWRAAVRTWENNTKEKRQRIMRDGQWWTLQNDGEYYNDKGARL